MNDQFDRGNVPGISSRTAIFILCLVLAYSASGLSVTGSSIPTQKGATVTKHATGTFDVNITPQPAEEKVGDPSITRMSGEKQYHGDLEGTGRGQMLAGIAPETNNSGAYVAIERVRGTLEGRSGSFSVYHRGIMDRGAQDLVISVIPDSGTEEFKGITGTMTIDIRDGKHFYRFDYTIP